MSEQDRELLELAAKAAGLSIRDEWAYDESNGLKIRLPDGSTEWWNPLANKGDALVLAAYLRFGVRWDGWGVHITAFDGGDTGPALASVKCKWDGDCDAALCRAATKAAAEIGRAMG